MRAVSVISGLFLVVMGILLFTGKFTMISQYLVAFPR